jgi:diguanylate cyclase (GGDEF)-like protein
MAESLLKGIHENTVEMRRLFDLPTGELENPDQILARANEALLQISLQSAQQTSQLEMQNKQLAEQATTDSLTGAANRRKFNDFLEARFAEVRPGGGPLSVFFLDTDHFKKFNDAFGHQTGDRVLIELTAVLKEAAPRHALVARYGGEEFAVVLPRTDRITAARLAEETRNRIGALVVTSDDGRPLSITASIGVATYEGTFFTRFEQLVKAADQAVYAAKDAGRNCVRVFRPRQDKPPLAMPTKPTQQVA